MPRRAACDARGTEVDKARTPTRVSILAAINYLVLQLCRRERKAAGDGKRTSRTTSVEASAYGGRLSF